MVCDLIPNLLGNGRSANLPRPPSVGQSRPYQGVHRRYGIYHVCYITHTVHVPLQSSPGLEMTGFLQLTENRQPIPSNYRA